MLPLISNAVDTLREIIQTGFSSLSSSVNLSCSEVLNERPPPYLCIFSDFFQHLPELLKTPFLLIK